MGLNRAGSGSSVQSPLSVGQFAGKWCSYNAPPDLPYDQREEDGGSLIFDGDVLTERMEILGAPVANLEFAVDQPVAMVAVRLSDVAPDGRATRISYGLLNLTHRAGHDRPEALTPGERYRVGVTLKAMAQAHTARSSLRLALSTSYWPLAWPPPQPVQLTVYPAQRAGAAAAPRPRSRRAAGAVPRRAGRARPQETTQLKPARHRWTVTRDLIDYESTMEVVKDLGVGASTTSTSR